MKTTLAVLVFALNAWMATCLPIDNVHHHNEAASISLGATPHNTFQYASTFSSSSNKDKNPHFLEWLAEIHPEHRDAYLKAESRRKSSHRNSGGRTNNGNDGWMSQARKALKTWSAFYGIEYPTKPYPSHSSPSSWKTVSYDSPEIMEEAEEFECGAVIVDRTANGDTTITTTPCPPSSYTHHQKAARKSYSEQLRCDLAHMDLAEIFDKYGPEIVALCIFLLIPISVVLVEIVDMLHNKWIPEQFPERGRGRTKLTGEERQLSVLAKCEREKMVRCQAQKLWVGSRRGSRTSK